MWIGKIIGFLIGLSVAGPLGAFIGLVVGHLFDKGRARIYQDFNPTRRAQVEETFFRTVFCLLGRLAKTDGRITEAEISDTEKLMTKMRLAPAQRQRAIGFFKEGASPEFDTQSLLATFNRECGRYANLKQILLVYLISLALADGEMKEAEKRFLEEVAQALGFSSAMFNQILRMAMAQNHFYRYGQGGFRQQQGYSGGAHQGGQRQGYQQRSSADELATAYEALGIEKSASDADVKKAYRKLMSQYHPDKLSGRGVPQDMIEVATERAQEIQSAYDLIKKSRNMR